MEHGPIRPSSPQPLNPVLGELFYGTWPDVNGRGETVLVVEQVSHHPPIVSVHCAQLNMDPLTPDRLVSPPLPFCARQLTLSFIENKKAGVALQGHSGQKTSFTGTAINGAQA